MRRDRVGQLCPAIRSPRRALAVGQLLLATALVGAAGAASVFWYARPFGTAIALDDGIIERVVRRQFVHDISERGELESSASVPVRCEVQARSGTNGVKILEIVPEGTVVKKGDFLVRFDDAAIRSDRTTQQINVGSAEAAAAQSKNDLEAAQIARQEYEFGEFETEREKINGEVLVASQAVTHAEESVAHTKKMLRRGYVPKLQLQSEEFRLAKSQSDLRAAKVKLNSLLEYTKRKKISELDTKIKTCEAKLKSDEAKLVLEQQKLQLLDDQIAKCVVKAPNDGQVIYDHERDRWGGSEYQIKQGATVDEQRVVIRLPDPARMQVVAKVAESRIDRIKVGMPAKIEIEGLPNVKLDGKVIRVNEYPEPENWLSAGVKEYAATVQVLEPPAGLRPGMTARASIRVETIDDAVQVPIQAVMQHAGRHYCLRRQAKQLEPRAVVVGSTNEKFVVVREGLAEGDEVLLNPRSRLSDDELEKVAGAQGPATSAPETAQRPASEPNKSEPVKPEPAKSDDSLTHVSAAAGGPGS